MSRRSGRAKRNCDDVRRMKRKSLRGAAITPTTGLRAIARAFFLSLCVHAALGAIVWYLISTSLQPKPHEQRVEVELTAANARISSAAAAPTLMESLPNVAASKHDEVRADRIAHVPARIAPTKPYSGAPTETIANAPSLAGDAPFSQQDATRPAQAQDAPALDLRVLDWLARYRTYPLAARRARLEGVVQLRVTLMPDGRFVDVRVERSSGHVLLDRAALDLLARASPLPAEFASERSAQIELQLPIVYRMRTSSS